MYSIELEITNECNALCNSCSRHKGLIDVSDSFMTFQQIEKFVNEVNQTNGLINYIHILGGEPTIHPDFEKIVLLIYNELFLTKKIKHLNIVTNGINKISDSIIKLDVIISIAKPIDKINLHRCQWVAPIDYNQEQKKCTVQYDCGISLNKYGYFPCGAGGAIIRLFGLEKYIKYSLPESPESFGNIQEICNLCQASAKEQMMTRDYGNLISQSFEKAIKNYKPLIKTY